MNRKTIPLLLAAFLLPGLVVAAALTRPAQAVPQTAVSDDAPLCRFGVNVLETQTIASLPGLGAGWYMNFTTLPNPPRPEGMEYMPVIRLRPSATPPGYTYQPNGSALQQAISNSPGAKWLISNEPDSTQQDDLTPPVYARAYHELYGLLKTADPAAQVIAGSIIQATPMRLFYLDQILGSYYNQFGAPLPTDGWSIHNYILNEVSCDYNPANCWGAGIPPGVDWLYGEVWGLRDTDRLDIFTQRITRFRQWMADRGYRGAPLYLTEYGVLMPPDFADEDGVFFTAARVNAFMNGTYDYMLNATHPTLGNPLDENRLVQQWAWYSTTDDRYNGVLLDPITYAPTEIGANFAAYTAVLNREIDFYPTAVKATTSALSLGQPVTLTLHTQVANSGNLSQAAAATVQFYHGNPAGGGVPLGPAQNMVLSGCGQAQTFSVVWPDVAPGVYDIYVQVTPGAGVVDVDTSNNLVVSSVVVGVNHLFLPIISRAINW
ncbi:MAG: hypothetical protein IPM39_13960 [Chloroflexi bacterium]|nr:hypothetical protein [Chloroflexota bacterium]